jgi:hypothetical protein
MLVKLSRSLGFSTSHYPPMLFLTCVSCHLLILKDFICFPFLSVRTIPSDPVSEAYRDSCDNRCSFLYCPCLASCARDHTRGWLVTCRRSWTEDDVCNTIFDVTTCNQVWVSLNKLRRDCCLLRLPLKAFACAHVSILKPV